MAKHFYFWNRIFNYLELFLKLILIKAKEIDFSVIQKKKILRRVPEKNSVIKTFFKKKFFLSIQCPSNDISLTFLKF